MAAVFPTMLRGMVGIAAAVLVVALAWTLYINREHVADAGEPVIELISNVTDSTAEEAAAKDDAVTAAPPADSATAAPAPAPAPEDPAEPASSTSGSGS